MSDVGIWMTLLGPSPFWPAMQCVTTLMEKLGSRTWFQLSPSELFLAVTEHPTYQSEIAKWDGYHGDGGLAPANEWCVSSGQSSEPLTRGGSVPSAQPRKASLAWFMPFVHSLLNFGTLYKDCVSHVIYHVHRLSGERQGWGRGRGDLGGGGEGLRNCEFPSLILPCSL